MDLFSIKDKTVLISGASRGIGLVLANGMSKEGANVFGFGRTNLKEHTNINFQYFQNDLADYNTTKNNVMKIIKKTRKIDILINTAGITNSNNTKNLLENFKKVLDVNLIAPFNLINQVIPIMKKNNSGSIINITSINAHQGFPDNPSYISSKGGLSSLTQSLALDLGKYNIRVNNLAPGYIKTNMTKKSYMNEEEFKKRVSRTILQRWGDPDDLLGPCIFLASDASKYITGSDLIVDGGWLAKGL